MNRLPKSSDTPARTKSTHELLGDTNETSLTRKIAQKTTQESLKGVVVDKLRFCLVFFNGFGGFFKAERSHLRNKKLRLCPHQTFVLKQ